MRGVAQGLSVLRELVGWVRGVARRVECAEVVHGVSA